MGIKLQYIFLSRGVGGENTFVISGLYGELSRVTTNLRVKVINIPHMAAVHLFPK